MATDKDIEETKRHLDHLKQRREEEIDKESEEQKQKLHADEKKDEG
jgi:hypothetical protein